jgi:DNA mismatch repair ATPase MutS
MQQYYAVFSDAGIAACMQYSFGFNAYAEHMAHFVELVQNKRVSACEFVSKSKAEDDKIHNDNDVKKKDKKKKKKAEDAAHSVIVNGYYVATALNDDSNALGPVKNTVTLDKRLVITGPNASGKTTILKMTMLNILFSQQLGHGFYEAGTRICPYDQLHSYLNIPDTSGRDSLFQAESRRCKEILDKLTGVPTGTTTPPTSMGEGGQSPPVRHFCIFDELYSGTNPYEAIASAYGYIMHLAKLDNVDFMLTTHYIQLCKLFESESESDKREKIANKSEPESEDKLEPNKIQNLHMEVADRGNYDFKYLYTLRPGISAIKGGIKVLYDLQYPASIVETTRRILSAI